VVYTGEPNLAAILADPIFNEQMTTIHADLDAIAEQCQNAVTWRKRIV